MTISANGDLRGVLAVIPARYASSRFPGKPLVPICGIPLVLRVHERVSRAIPTGQIVVATDDERIVRVCEAAGVRVSMTRAGCVTGTDRVWDAASETACEIIVNVQGDEPLVTGDDIITVIRAKRSRPQHVVNAMCAITDIADVTSTHVPKVVVADDGRLVYMSRSPVPFAKSAGVAAVFRRQVCIYAFSRQQLEAFAGLGHQSGLERTEDIEILRFLDLGIGVHMVEVPRVSLAVDVPLDVPRVEAALRLEGSR
ncbi:MAG: 3-deoxy-manno-octulosonate cytidylyltransferase [Gemmatimonadaceae bacterium]